jgi:3-hydroxyacyl-[acyl-carrier-protein] dehydratase
MESAVLSAEQVRAILPHRGPMLLIDEVVALEPGVAAVAVHRVRADAFWVEGHFPTEPIMPGVLIAEAMAQTAALAVLSADPASIGAVYLVGYDKLRFRRPVRPGDTLRLVARHDETRRRIATFTVEAFVGDDRGASGAVLATLP